MPHYLLLFTTSLRYTTLPEYLGRVLKVENMSLREIYTGPLEEEGRLGTSTQDGEKFSPG